MASPTLTKTWSITANNRITFVSVADTLARYLFGVKAFLKTAGYTVKGSCDGVTGAMDGVDRWVTSANALVHATAANVAQSWIVLTDSNAVDIVLANWHATDISSAAFGFSPGAVMAVGSPTTAQPVATDIVGVTTIGLVGVGSPTTLDRVWNCWVDSSKKMFRSNIARNSVWVAQHWGVELLSSEVSSGPAAFSPTVWMFTTASNAVANGTRAGSARPLVASVPPGNSTSNLCYFITEWFGLSSAAFSTVQPPLQGGGYPAIPLGVAMNASQDGSGHIVGFTGRLGQLFDWWMGKSDAVAGDTFVSQQFLAIDGVNGSAAGGVWPWNGATTPVVV